MRGSCGDRVVAVGVHWIAVEGGSWEVDWGGAGVMEAGGTGGIWWVGISIRIIRWTSGW